MLSAFKMFSKEKVCVLKRSALRKQMKEGEKPSSIRRVGERRSKQVASEGG